MKLHPIHGNNKFCGPGAVSAITGCSTDVAALLMRRYSGRAAIKGAFDGEVRSALSSLGFLMVEVRSYTDVVADGRSYARWCRQTARARGADIFLLSYGWHYAVVQGRRHACGLRRDVCFQSEAPMRRAKLKNVWRIMRDPRGASVQITELEESRKATPRQRQNQAARAKAKALLRAYPQVRVEIDQIERGHRHLWVVCDLFKTDETGDPFEGDHIVSDWIEALPRIEEYVKLVQPQVTKTGDAK